MTPRKVAGEKTNLAAVGTSTKFVNDEAKIVPKSEETVKKLVPHLKSKTEKLFKNTKIDKTVKENDLKETTEATGVNRSEINKTISDLEYSTAENESNTNKVKGLDILDSAETEKATISEQFPGISSKDIKDSLKADKLDENTYKFDNQTIAVTEVEQSSEKETTSRIMDNLKNRKEMIITVKPEEIIESALGVKYTDLRTVHNFMYHGEVNVAQKELNCFLAKYVGWS